MSTVFVPDGLKCVELPALRGRLRLKKSSTMKKAIARSTNPGGRRCSGCSTLSQKLGAVPGVLFTEGLRLDESLHFAIPRSMAVHFRRPAGPLASLRKSPGANPQTNFKSTPKIFL